MKRKIAFAAGMLLAGLAFAGIANAEDVGAGVEISLATVIPDGVPITIGLAEVSEKMNEAGFDTAVYPAGQLGSLTDVMDRCLQGENTIMTCDPADLADITVSDMAIVQAPFLYETWEEADKIFSSDWWAGIVAKAEEKGMKIIASNWSFGNRHILTNDPVESIADMKGKKIRVPNNTNFVQTFTAFGAVPTPMNLADVYSALQQKTIDGLENPLSDIYANKFQEVSKYCVTQAHIKQDCLIICGMDFWNTLTEEQQETITRIVQEAGISERAMLDDVENETFEKLKEEGVTFTDIDLDEFVAATDAYYEGCSKELGWSEGLHETILEILAE